MKFIWLCTGTDIPAVNTVSGTKINIRATIGITVGILIFVIIAFFIVVCIIMRRRCSNRSIPHKKFEDVKDIGILYSSEGPAVSFNDSQHEKH